MSQLTLRAYAPADGWAFVGTDESHLLFLRPPYRRDQTREISLGTLEWAVAAYGFETSQHVFESWQALLKFLRDSIVAAHASLPEAGTTWKEIVQNANASVLSAILDRVEGASSSPQDCLGLEALLAAALSSPAAEDRDTRLRVTKLLEVVITGRNQRADLLDTILGGLSSEEVSAHYPLAAKRFSAERIVDTMKRIASGHQILELVG